MKKKNSNERDFHTELAVELSKYEGPIRTDFGIEEIDEDGIERELEADGDIDAEDSNDEPLPSFARVEVIQKEDEGTCGRASLIKFNGKEYLVPKDSVQYDEEGAFVNDLYSDELVEHPLENGFTDLMAKVHGGVVLMRRADRNELEERIAADGDDGEALNKEEIEKFMSSMSDDLSEEEFVEYLMELIDCLEEEEDGEEDETDEEQ